MSSALKNNLQDAMKAAMKAGDKQRLAVIRLIMSALKQVEVDERVELDDTRITGILDKMLKQRRESISMFDQAGRGDLASIERAEIEVIQAFLPQPLSDDEIDAIVKEAISQTGAASIKDMGKVMGIVRPQVIGRGDMSVISEKIKTTLST
ncbi:MAG: GatB/YqeY domain-containing protein [Gammaproteobacteria bacterium]|jgi:uncharacterized protein YqeY|nr:GatB/YqeY domain-containing protein [Gammaproteobacteria bacterium]